MPLLLSDNSKRGDSAEEECDDEDEEQEIFLKWHNISDNSFSYLSGKFK